LVEIVREIKVLKKVAVSTCRPQQGARRKGLSGAIVAFRNSFKPRTPRAAEQGLLLHVRK
jgi:hypothetical protein